MPGKFNAPTIQLSELVLEDSGYHPHGFSTRICRIIMPGRLNGKLYKEYSEKAREKLNEDGLDDLICWARNLPLADRIYLHSFCAFPQGIVLDDEQGLQVW